jgi:nitrogen fixation/metabolism regulation signal transduction histidine kinase
MVVSVGTLPMKGEVFVRLSHSGRPMPEDDRYALLDSNLSAKSFAGGLGLPLARKIIASHGGRIEIERHEETGNRVVIYLPQG